MVNYIPDSKGGFPESISQMWPRIMLGYLGDKPVSTVRSYVAPSWNYSYVNVESDLYVNLLHIVTNKIN